MGTMSSRARERAKKRSTNRLPHIRGRKRERSFCRGLCSNGATIRHESKSCDCKVAARDSPFRTSAGHMAVNLVQNVKEVLKGFPARNIHGWLDSTVALH